MSFVYSIKFLKYIYLYFLIKQSLLCVKLSNSAYDGSYRVIVTIIKLDTLAIIWKRDAFLAASFPTMFSLRRVTCKCKNALFKSNGISTARADAMD